MAPVGTARDGSPTQRASVVSERNDGWSAPAATLGGPRSRAPGPGGVSWAVQGRPLTNPRSALRGMAGAIADREPSRVHATKLLVGQIGVPMARRVVIPGMPIRQLARSGAWINQALAALNNGDMDRLLACCNPNIVAVWQNNEVCQGPEAIRRFYARVYTGPDRRVDKGTSRPEVDGCTSSRIGPLAPVRGPRHPHGGPGMNGHRRGRSSCSHHHCDRAAGSLPTFSRRSSDHLPTTLRSSSIGVRFAPFRHGGSPATMHR